MGRALFWLALLAISMAPLGCSYLGPRGGPAYEIDYDKVGTGEQAIEPRSDAHYWNGEAMNYRSRR